MRAFIYILLLFISCSAWSQSTHALGGKITDSQNASIEYCTISLLASSDSTIVKGTISGAQGIYYMKGIPAGRYLLRASLLGYATQFHTIEITADKTYDITLQAVAQQLNDVSVVADRITRKHDRYIINMVSNPIAQGHTALESLKLMPGVVEIEGALSVNGQSVSEIYINGRLAERQELEGIQATDIQSVEVIENDGQRLRASSGKAVIKIRLRRQATLGFYGNATAGASVGKDQGITQAAIPFYYKIGRWNLYNYLSGTLWNNPYIRDIDTRYHSDNRIVSTHSEEPFKQKGIYEVVSAVLELNSRQSIGVTANFNARHNQEGVESSSDFTGMQAYHSDYLQKGNRDVRKYQATLNYQAKLDEKGSEFRLLADYLHNLNDYDDMRHTRYSGIYPDDSLRNLTNSLSKQWKVTADLDLARWSNTSLRLGTDYLHNHTSNDISFFRHGDAGWELSETSSDRFRFIGSGWGAYADYTRQLNDWTLNAALRLQGDYVTIRGKNEQDINTHYLNLFPEATVSYLFSKKHGTRLSVYFNRGMSSIRYSDMNPIRIYTSDIYYETGNPNLRPSTYYSIGMRFQANRHLQINYSYSRSKDDVNFRTFSDADDSRVTYRMPDNFGRGYTHDATVTYNRQFFNWWINNSTLQGSLGASPFDGRMVKRKYLFAYLANSFPVTSRSGFEFDFYWEKGARQADTYYHSVYSCFYSYYHYFFGQKLLAKVSSNYQPYRARILTVDNVTYHRSEANNSRRNYFTLSLTWRFKGGRKVEAKRVQSVLEMQESKVGAK